MKVLHIWQLETKFDLIQQSLDSIHSCYVTRFFINKWAKIAGRIIHGATSGFPLFWKKKIPGVFQSNFRIFQVLSVIVRNRISNTFGPH